MTVIGVAVLAAIVSASASAQDFGKPLIDPYVTPPDQVILADATADGCGLRYEIKRSGFSKQQLDWLGAILKFIHTPDEMPAHNFYEVRSAVSVSEAELRRVTSNKEFRRWAGPSVLKAIKVYSSARELIKKNEVKLFREGDLEYGGIIDKYSASRDRLVSSLTENFQVIRIDLGDECD